MILSQGSKVFLHVADEEDIPMDKQHDDHVAVGRS